MNRQHILLIDEHILLMEGIRAFLAPHGHMRVVAMANSAEKALWEAKEHKPHVCIMEMNLPDMQGQNLIPALRKAAPKCQILLYTMHTDQRYLLEFIHLGVTAFVHKSDNPTTLVSALNALWQGQVFFNAYDPCGVYINLMRKNMENLPPQSLTELSQREKEIFILLADGENIKNIAANLHISPKTVESHKYNLFHKLHITSLSQLTKLAIRHGLVQV